MAWKMAVAADDVRRIQKERDCSLESARLEAEKDKALDFIFASSLSDEMKAVLQWIVGKL